MEFIINGHSVKTGKAEYNQVAVSINGEFYGKFDSLETAVDCAREFIDKFSPATPEKKD